MKPEAEKNPAAVALGKLSAAKRAKAAKSADEFKNQMGELGKSAWADMTDEEKSAELSRRRKLGLKKGKRGGGRKAKVVAGDGNNATVKGSKLQKAS